VRLLLFSNAPHAGTGYGVQTALLAEHLQKAGHEVAILAYFGLEGAQLMWKPPNAEIGLPGIPVFPRSRHPASQDFMVPLAKQLGVDAVVAITDAWVVETHRFKDSGIAYVPWFPCDCEPMDQENARGIAGPGPDVRLPVATSEHAAAMARERGITDVRVIPYMVDTGVYSPGDRAEARKGWGIPEDAFVVGMVAMNKTAAGIDRKRFEEQIAAFARLRLKHEDAILYLHTHVTAPDGVHLPTLLKHYRVPPDAVMFTDGIVLTVGAPPPLMADLYRSFDVLTLVSGGEGAGMPLLEAAACGVRTIWGDWTAMPQYGKAGWALARGDAQPQMNAGRVWWRTPDVDCIHDLLQRAYEQDDRARAVMESKARDLAMNHDPYVVMPMWLDAIDELARRLEEAKGVTTVPIPEALKAGVGA
jgi:glycosyltransferase involved in cell wall biosynthesis